MSESERLSRKLDSIRCCEVNLALQAARNIYGNTCRDACLKSPLVLQQETPLESDLLMKNTGGTCYSVIGTLPTTESQRLNTLVQCVEDASVSAFNSDTRFKVYASPPAPPVCPPVPQEVLNANLPKPSTRCIPGGANKPYLSLGI
jgi:hypothetical protein